MQSDRLEDLLRGEREAVPEAGAEDRIWAAVEHRLAHGPAPPGGADVDPGALGGATGGGGVVLKVIAGVALIAAAVGLWSARDRPEAPQVVSVAAIEAVPEARPNIATPAPLAPAPEPVVTPSVTPAPAVVEAPEPAPEEPTEARKKSRPRPRIDAPPVEEEPADFAAELKLIAEIRGALKRNDSARALAGVDEHARRFAGGQLVQERIAYHVEALCAAGRVADARRVARDMLAKWPDSTHAPRVKSSCAGA
ncbi:hypothetical protein [Nannocystis bainbridge]|uniref:Meckel syndrome type 1 protein n=1 Tax=Nannocystis bainbridge TaxID=2995303 RepID=A0ABT5DTP0_9BACT|nr:hypothetical protein [Nannocystis bainbridge]MDC0717010.1 hypothetical protein [Nannocystis bainbridge]